jgi:antitoxin VapB
MTVAKVFTHGGSQAVRLPLEFRFKQTEVHVRRVGDDVVLSPKAPGRVQSLIDALDMFEPGFELEREAVDFDAREPIDPVR